MTYADIQSKGGNQYLVTIGHEAKLVDLDGFTILSDEEMEKVEAAGLEDDYMMCPRDSEFSGPDSFFKAAVEHAAAYSGFNADDYIANRK